MVQKDRACICTDDIETQACISNFIKGYIFCLYMYCKIVRALEHVLLQLHEYLILFSVRLVWLLNQQVFVHKNDCKLH